MSMMEGSRSEVLEVTFYQQGALLKRRVFAPQGDQERWRVIGLSGALVEPSIRVVGQQSGSTAMLLSVELIRSQEVYREQAPPGWRLGPEQDQGEESALTNEQRTALLDSLRVRRERLLKIRPQRLGREGGVSQSLSAGRFIESALDALDQRQALLESEIQHRGVHDEGTEQVVQRSELLLSFSLRDRRPDFIDIEYFVTSARWWPCYTLHFEDGGRRARLELEAQLWQESGERWSKVKLRVTNAPAPAFESSLPIPLRRELRPAQSAGGDPGAGAEESLGGSRGDLLSGYREAERLQRLHEPQSTGCLDEHTAPSEYAAELSHFQLASPHQGLGFFYIRGEEEQTPLHLAPPPPVVSELLQCPRPVEGALFVYEASAPLTVESSDVLQRLPLTSYQGEAKTTLTLCPAQGASAYRKGTLINPTAAPLLPGPIDLFYDGLLLRRGVLPL
ncbi:MAG: DUF4139 domain-containing protein, partial [Myxococcota bacterium]|nr:DUF4139 domain-containing protein [Myxococcota bacterium]